MAKNRSKSRSKPAPRKRPARSKKPRTRKAGTSGRAPASRSGASASDQDFAGLLAAHIERTGIKKADLARAIDTAPQYIREIETGRKPPPTLDKVEVLAEVLDLSGPHRDLFVSRAREGRTKPESREYIRNLEAAFAQLMEIFAVDVDDRERIRHGEFQVLTDRIRSAVLESGQVERQDDFLPFLQVMRYRTFITQLVDGMDSLKENFSDEDVAWVQGELMKQMQRLVGLRKGEAEISDKLKRGVKGSRGRGAEGRD
jgi:ribosome-binding protein aMBF1 (putative translation factor)